MASHGPTIVLCHPAPGSGAFDPGPATTWSRDVTLLAIDRPGYGRSDPMPSGAWATVASAGVMAKTLLLFGQRDPLAPGRHARWWLNHLPQARMEISPSAGHLLILDRWERTLPHLAPRGRRP
jgi:pimeloyl-ACP methyl ester carboxylesterase